MTVAQRTVGTAQWRFKQLPSKLKWDNHNWVVLALDETDCLHVSGNMHGTRLVYFRAALPLDIDSLAPAPMVGDSENRITYPLFLAGPRGALVYHYRHGGSGNGDVLFNEYNAAARTWRRLHGGPLIAGEGQRSPYMSIARGPGGDFHMIWLWRDTRDAGSCHDLCYARSPDLLRWETAAGEPLQAPIRFADTPRAVVDPVRPGGGAFNTLMTVGFDAARRPVIAYAKDDPRNRTQLHLARREGGRWAVRAASGWGVRYAMAGAGWFDLPLELGPVEWRGGRLQIRVLHGRESPAPRPFRIDPATMRLAGPADDPEEAALAGLGRAGSEFPGMQVQWRGDDGPGSGDGAAHRLRWESLPRNRDRKPRPPHPEPSLLQVVTVAAPRGGPGGSSESAGR